MSWGIFIHHPDGDMGEGIIVGPFRNVGNADRAADEIREAAIGDIECIIVPTYSTRTDPAWIANEFMHKDNS